MVEYSEFYAEILAVVNTRALFVSAIAFSSHLPFFFSCFFESFGIILGGIKFGSGVFFSFLGRLFDFHLTVVLRNYIDLDSCYILFPTCSKHIVFFCLDMRLTGAYACDFLCILSVGLELFYCAVMDSCRSGDRLPVMEGTRISLVRISL